jgi:para-nitrobenzyl esterase
MEFDTGLPPGLRAMHTAELPMTLDLNWRLQSAELSRQISGAWAAFARNGDPNHAGLPAWPAFRPDAQECMIFDLQSTAGPDQQAAPRRELLAALAGAPHWNPL